MNDVVNNGISMSVVNPSAELVDIDKLVKNRFKLSPERKELEQQYSPCEIVMEHIGRVCYNSHDAMTDDSIDKFLTTAANKGHRSIFEFGMLQYTAVFNIATAEMVYDLLTSNKYVQVQVKYTEDQETAIVIIKGSPRAFMEILELFLMDDITLMPAIFFKTLYNMINTLLPSMASHWETADSLMIFDAAIGVDVIDNQDCITLVDITTDYANRSDFTKFLVYVICDRSVSHEIVRHRPVSYMQESQRYIRFDINNPYVICLGTVQQETMGQIVIDMAMDAFVNYSELLANNRPENARLVLPNCAKTSIFIYADKEEYRHFFRMRQSKFAYPPIKEVFDMLYYKLIDNKFI